MNKIILAGAALALTACSHGPKPTTPEAIVSHFPEVAVSSEPSGIPDAPIVAEAPREHVSVAISLLGSGKAAEAKAELQAALDKSPRNATALSLMKQIDSDPVLLLGATSDPYVVQAGDTMSGLAQRFTGDPLMFYALSRYNGIAAPNTLSVGRTIKAPRLKAATAPELRPLPATAAPAKISDPAKANAIRQQALELLATGEAKRAVLLLQQAQALNVGDEAIQRDLERAKRIEAVLVDG